jgi:fermentation-respiration switch protein FrsA (DUF1100 family)
MARLHYPAIPRALVPDAYPSLELIRGLRAPLLVLHGDRDDVVPLAHGETVFAAAPEPKAHAHLPRCGAQRRGPSRVGAGHRGVGRDPSATVTARRWRSGFRRPNSSIGSGMRAAASGVTLSS